MNKEIIKIIINFNSIKVRLELALDKLYRLSAQAFQFHKGAIRTNNTFELPKTSTQISIP